MALTNNISIQFKINKIYVFFIFYNVIKLLSKYNTDYYYVLTFIIKTSKYNKTSIILDFLILILLCSVVLIFKKLRNKALYYILTYLILPHF